MQLLFKPKQVDVEKPKSQNPNRVREHLANERTYLAWMRTAIAMMGFGVVIVRLRVFRPPVSTPTGNGWKLGIILSLLALVTVLLTTGHYFAVRHDIDEDSYDPPDRWVILFSLAVIILGAGVIYYVFTAPLNPNSIVVPD